MPKHEQRAGAVGRERRSTATACAPEAHPSGSVGQDHHGRRVDDGDVRHDGRLRPRRSTALANQRRGAVECTRYEHDRRDNQHGRHGRREHRTTATANTGSRHRADPGRSGDAGDCASHDSTAADQSPAATATTTTTATTAGREPGQLNVMEHL